MESVGFLMPIDPFSNGLKREKMVLIGIKPGQYHFSYCACARISPVIARVKPNKTRFNTGSRRRTAQQQNLPTEHIRRSFAPWQPMALRRTTSLSDRSAKQMKYRRQAIRKDSQTVGLSVFLGTFVTRQKYPGGRGREVPGLPNRSNSPLPPPAAKAPGKKGKIPSCNPCGNRV